MADAEQCFGKSMLQDCLVDMKEARTREQGIQMLFSLNNEQK